MICRKCKKGLAVSMIVKEDDEYHHECLECRGALLTNDPRSVSRVRWDLKEEFRTKSEVKVNAKEEEVSQ